MLAEAFRIGLEMIGQARAQANLMTQLNAVGTILHRDLVVAHPFLPDDSRPNRGLRLSDQRLDLLTADRQGWTPPPGGFFRIVSPDSASIPDNEGLNIYTADNHALHFTAILPANETNLFHARVNFIDMGGNPLVKEYESRAAEIAYFLVHTGNNTPGGSPLYNLIRRQRLVAIDNNSRTSLLHPVNVTPANNPEYECSIALGPSGPVTLREIRNPDNRLQLPPPPVSVPSPPSLPPLPPFSLPIPQLPQQVQAPWIFPSGSPNHGADILLSNVLSFEVRVDWDPNPNVILNSSNPPRSLPVNAEYPYDNLTANIGRNPAFQVQLEPPPAPPRCTVFDTWYDQPNWNTTFATLPLAIRVRGIQVSVRVFDPKTRAVRQNTWRFAL